ncbi:MAG TPA: squalene synthase HpnC [Actinomycetota bacterium]|nr:squalene synthase HpnC [Actinomycetota bacterium]
MTEPVVDSSLQAGAIMAKAGRENFPVASRLLPGRTREHLLAIYGFARLVDDLGDEASGDRPARLDWLERELDLVYNGTPEHPLMRRLVATVQRFDLLEGPFRRLIEANRQDQRVASYATFQDLLAYCDLSANPVGRLVLSVLEARTAERTRLSDAVCTGLQLTEHWQDVKEDLGRGRIYLPQEDLARFGCPVEDLGAARPSAAFRRLMAFQVDRARTFLDQGAPLAADLRGRAGMAVAAFVAGGRSALDAIARAGYDVLGSRPRPSKAARLSELVRTLVRVNRRAA